MAVAPAGCSLSSQQIRCYPTLASSSLGLPLLQRGKVRDIYRLGDLLALVATDRLSAFDRSVALIPLKGWALTRQTTWWFNQCSDIIANHLIDTIAGRVLVVKPCRVIAIEVIVRGYLSGSTATSIWQLYAAGQRRFADLQLPDGMTKNSRLPRPIITPTTKEALHDRPLSVTELINLGLVSAGQWRQIEEVAHALFARGQQLARQAGLLLLDTKYEFGIDDGGNLLLIDELHSGDSSRYCDLDSQLCDATAHYDKEFLRLWLSERCNPYQEELPAIPPELIYEQSRRYLALYERLSNQSLQSIVSELPRDNAALSLQIEKYLAQLVPVKEQPQ